MNQKLIEIKGISKNTNVQDGECRDIINIRPDNGSYSPVAKDILLKNLQNEYQNATSNNYEIHSVYYHAKAEKYLAVAHDKSTILVFQNDFTFAREAPADSFKTSSQVNQINFIGNIAIFTTVSNIEYFVFRDDRYIYLGEKPEMPQINITVSRKVFTHGRLAPGIRDQSSKDYYLYKAKGLIDACIHKGNKEACYIDRTIVRFALRMYDGTYVMHSGLYLIEDDCKLAEEGTAIYAFADSNIDVHLTGDGKHECRVKMFSLGYSFPNLNLENWRDIIVGIDVFTTKSITTQKEEKGVKSTKETASFEHADHITIPDKDLIGDTVSFYKTDYDFRYKITSESSFYKVASFDINGKIIGSNPKTDVSNDNIVLNDELTDDSNTHDSFYSINPFVYNSRLHLGGCYQKLFQGYNMDSFIDFGLLDQDLINGYNVTLQNVDVYVFLKTEDGERIVKKNFPEFKNIISRLITYPDYRAYKMIFVFELEDIKLRASFNLTKHEKLNLSYYLSPNNTSDTGRYKPSIAPIVLSLVANVRPERPNYTVQDTIKRKDILKVSKIDNPFFFPNSSTYNISNGDIVGLSSATSALSTGQFGEFPLYVFSTDGIYAMAVDTSGKTVYLNSSSVSRDVCNNPDSITPSLGGIFFSTEQGIMFLSGSNIENVSTSLLGPIKPPDNLINKFYGINNFAYPDMEFKEYIKNAKIAYRYNNNEIIVSNSSKEYHFIFNINAKTWYRATGKYNSFINVYPRCYALKGAEVYNIDSTAKDANKFIILSRPMKLESNGYKKIFQSAFRGDFKIIDKLCFYLFGTQDGYNFNLVAIKEIENKNTDLLHRIDAILNMNKTKAYKHYSFAITGTCHTDSKINTLGVMFDYALDNRIR